MTTYILLKIIYESGHSGVTDLLPGFAIIR